MTIKTDNKIFHLNVKLIANDSDTDEAFKSMHQSIMTKIKSYSKQETTYSEQETTWNYLQQPEIIYNEQETTWNNPQQVKNNLPWHEATSNKQKRCKNICLEGWVLVLTLLAAFFCLTSVKVHLRKKEN